MTKDKRTLEVILSNMEAACLNAAKHVVSVATKGEKFDSWRKDDKTLVTDVDIECDRLIKGILLPAIPILTEEITETHNKLNTEKQYFLVDPLDGTSAFSRFMGTFGGQVGFGPLIGYVEEGLLKAAVFFNVTQMTLLSAILGKGCSALKIDQTMLYANKELEKFSIRPKLKLPQKDSLKDSALIFFTGEQGEATIAEVLRKNNVIQTSFRFGGFANDSSRVALGYEEIQFQTTVKPWDFSAVLLAYEAGCDVIVDPLHKKIDFIDWKIQMNNPVIVVRKGLKEELFKNIRNE